MNRRTLIQSAGALSLGSCAIRPAPSLGQTVWTFDRLDSIGGFSPRIEGAPQLIHSPYGGALQFDGAHDAVFIPTHPMAGLGVFTFEALFRPDGGAHEQRWFHLQESPATPDAAASATRMLFEIRVEGAEWWLDAFARGPGYNHTLIFPERRYPVGRWFHVAQSYDGRMYRSFVNGALQGEAEIAFTPQGAGESSVGCRINRVSYFKGAVRQARFSPMALRPAEFIRA
jgi:hypothetical protein